MSQTTGAYNRIPRALFRGRRRFRQRHIDIPVHGSCSRCHHFHINCLVPHDTTAHTRVRCEQCGHQMFGLGSSTTQYTLASVNTGTVFPPRGCVEEQPRQAGSQGETVAVEDTQNASLHSPNLDHHFSFPANRMAESPEQTHQGNIQEPLRHTMRKRLKQWCSRPRKWSSSIRAMVQRLSNTTQGARPPAGLASSTTNNVSSASSPPSISQTPPGDPAGEASESITRPEPPSFHHHMNQPGEPTRERLRILRHGNTEQRKREIRSQCLCGQHCFCMNEGSRASNVAYFGSESQTRFRMQIEENRSSPQTDAPSHSLSGNTSETNGSPPSWDIPQETSLSGIGHHFDQHTPMSPDMLGLTAENSQRRSRFSQTPTTDANRSSITLSGRTASGATRNNIISTSNAAPEPDTHHGLPANSYTATSSQDPAERRVAGAFGSGRGGFTSPVQHDGVLDPNLIPTSQASFGSIPHHDSQVDHDYNAEETYLQVDGIAFEHTGEEESEADTSTRWTHDRTHSMDPTSLHLD